MFKKGMSLLLVAVLCLSLFTAGMPVKAEEDAGKAPETPEQTVNEPVVKTLLERLLECATIGSMNEIYAQFKTEVDAMTVAEKNQLIARYNELAPGEGKEPMELLTEPSPEVPETPEVKPETKTPEVKPEAPVADPEAKTPAEPKLLTAAELLAMEDYEALTAALTEAQISSLSAEDKAAVDARLAELKAAEDASKAVAEPILTKETYADMKAAYEALTDEQKATLLPKHKDAIEAKLAELMPLYDKLMACKTVAEMDAILDNLTEEEMKTLTEEQAKEIVDKLNALIKAEEAAQDAAANAPVEQPQETPAEPEAPYESKVDTPTYNYAFVAPFRAPVFGAYPEAPADDYAAAFAATTFAMPFAETFAEEPDNGVTVNKTAAPSKETPGYYTITLEAYATGDKVITEITENVPTDIVLVLDQSGSMGDEMASAGETTYNQYTGSATQNEKLYRLRHNGSVENPNLWYKLEEGKYVEVSVKREEKTEVIPGTPEEIKWQAYGPKTDNLAYYYNRTNLYEKVGAEYKPVSLTYELIWEGFMGIHSYNLYTYTRSDGSTFTSKRDGTVPALAGNGIEGGVLYKREVTKPAVPDKTVVTGVTYIYSYTLPGQPTVEIGRSEGDTTKFDVPLYEKNTTSSGTTTRIKALTTALNNFTDAVKAKAMGKDGKVGGGDDVNHRIAVIGFAGGKESKSKYLNSELFVGADQYNYQNLGMKESASGKDGKKDEGQFKNAFQNMNETTGQDNVKASIKALEAEGATNTHYGMEMAQKVLTENPVKGGEKRNRVVIVFTDGAPNKKNGFILDVANSAIDYSTAIKGTGATVYSVGVFNGANANSAGKKPSGDLESDHFPSSGDTTSEKAKTGINACNWFMQHVSSNTSYPQKPSYYLSAADSGTLNNIFEEIAHNIESGGSSSKLTEQAVIKDIVAPQFELPAGASEKDIHINTYAYQGGDQKDPKNWKLDNSAKGNAKVTLSTGIDAATDETVNRVSIDGFDYSKHYVGTVTDENNNVTARGHKLVITFDVRAKDAFFGGNHVNTNTKAELFEKPDAQKPVEVFPVPNVDVPLKEIKVTVPDGYVYLGGSVAQAELNKDLEIYVGTNKLDMTKGAKGYWGLKPWQVEGVTISTPDKLTAFQNMTADKDLTVHVKIDPAVTGTEKGHEGSGTGKIRVIRPVVTWRDSQINLGDTANYEKQNFVKVEWKYGKTPDTDTTISGHILDSRGTAAPALTYTYNPVAAAFKEDTPVKVTVTVPKHDGTAMDVTKEVTFMHETCKFDGCKWGTAPEFENPACQFIVQIKSFDLTITKKLTGNLMNSNDSFLFNITGPNGYTNTVVINGAGSVTIKGLPSGTYTVTEDTSWSWTYDIVGNAKKTVSPGEITGGKATVSFINTAKKDIPLSEETSVDNRWADGAKHPYPATK